MFVGHIAVGFAAKSVSPRTSLGLLVLASLLLDVLLWIFVLARFEHVAVKPGITLTNSLDLYDYPLSHSLLMAVFWGASMACVYYVVRRHSRGALLVFAAVVSHWFLDFLVHRPDLLLAPRTHKYLGLGLYNSRLAMLAVEGSLWLLGIVLYAHATRSRSSAGFWIMYLGLAALTWLWIESLSGIAPQVSMEKMGFVSLLFLAIGVSWACWVDKLRLGVNDCSPEPLVASDTHNAT
jgi:hypothetical protein